MTAENAPVRTLIECRTCAAVLAEHPTRTAAIYSARSNGWAASRNGFLCPPCSPKRAKRKVAPRTIDCAGCGKNYCANDARVISAIRGAARLDGWEVSGNGEFRCPKCRVERPDRMVTYACTGCKLVYSENDSRARKRVMAAAREEGWRIGREYTFRCPNCGPEKPKIKYRPEPGQFKERRKKEIPVLESVDDIEDALARIAREERRQRIAMLGRR